MEQETRVRFDPDARTTHQAELLAELYSYETAKSVIPPQAPDLRPLAADLDALASRCRTGVESAPHVLHEIS